MTYEMMILVVGLAVLFVGGGLFWSQPRSPVLERNSMRKSQPQPAPVADLPVMETDARLTARAEAKSANQLPRAEQLNNFEKHLEAHDSGNQPA